MALFGRPSQRDEDRAIAYTQWFQRQHPLALASVVLSVFSLTHLGTLWVDEIAGIVLGVVALMRLNRARCDASGSGYREGDWLAWAGIGVGTLSLVLAVLIYFVLPR